MTKMPKWIRKPKYKKLPRKQREEVVILVMSAEEHVRMMDVTAYAVETLGHITPGHKYVSEWADLYQRLGAAVVNGGETNTDIFVS